MSHHPPMGHPPGAYAGYRVHPQGHHGSSKNPGISRGGHPHPGDSRDHKHLPRSEPQPHSKPSAPRPTSRDGHVVVPARVQIEDVCEDSAPKEPVERLKPAQWLQLLLLQASLLSSPRKQLPLLLLPKTCRSTGDSCCQTYRSKGRRKARRCRGRNTAQSTTPQAAAPTTPGVRLGYDPSSSKKKRQLIPGQNEATFPRFGDMPEQPKATALAVFSFLSNDEIYNAALVSKRWNRLAMEEELWQF